MKNRECCLLTLQIGGREGKRGQSKFKVPSSTCQHAGGTPSIFLSLLVPHASLEVTQCTPSPSAMGAQLSELLPSSGLLPTTCFFNPCFHIESNLDLHAEKSYKLTKQNQTLSQQDGSFNFSKLHLGTLKKKKNHTILPLYMQSIC